MTRIVHLSDLHFGDVKEALVQPLFRAVKEARPELVVVSGDLVQRARDSQFARARAFLDALRLPWISVPGNHDIPLLNLFQRFIRPFAAYQRGINTDLQPDLSLGKLRFFGVNSVDPFSWRRGVARPRDIDRVCMQMRHGPKDVTNILIFHHPLEEPPGFEKGETRGADEALAALSEAGLHVVLSGHLHHWNPAPGVDFTHSRPILQVQTPTALSGRAGEDHHGFAVLDFDGPVLRLTPWFPDAAESQFRPAETLLYSRETGPWLQV